nr:hypothetical protein [uncultured Mediterranean phage uvMED]
MLNKLTQTKQGEKMIKISKLKNNDGIEFDTINIADCIRASEKIRDMNEKNYHKGFKKDDVVKPYFAQCSLCSKGIKDDKKSFGIICNLSDEIIVRRSHYDLSENSGGGMGCFDLGSECANRVKKALKGIGEDWKEWLSYHIEERA